MAILSAWPQLSSRSNAGLDHTILWAMSVFSLICCFGSAAALFSRKTAGAIVGGLVLLLLNAFIAFFFGCCASIKF